MFHGFRQSRPSLSLAISRVTTVFASSAILSACAHIEVESKDPQLVQFKQFAEKVALHIYDGNAAKYQANQALLGGEVTPLALRQLKSQGLCAKPSSSAGKTSAPDDGFHIDSSTFLKANANGLVPIEVKGAYSSGERKEKFDIVLLIGLSKKTHLPMVADAQVKK